MSHNNNKLHHQGLLLKSLAHRSLILLLGLLMAVNTSAGGKQKKLLILHTNDTHSCIMPLQKNLADTMLANRGGYLRRVAAINAERKNDPNLLLFDSGDFSQGSAYYTHFKGDVEVGLMNLMHYDAATIGNHEFDFGLDNMARIFKLAKFPIVCANYDFTGTPVEGLVKPYMIIKRKGLKIGVFGIAPKMDGLVTKENYAGVKYLDPVKIALETATMLKEEKRCDLVICLSHMGWKMSPLDDDEKVIRGSRNIDIVLGGHSHTYLKELEYCPNLDGRSIPVDQNGKHAIFVGRIELNLDKQ